MRNSFSPDLKNIQNIATEWTKVYSRNVLSIDQTHAAMSSNKTRNENRFRILENNDQQEEEKQEMKSLAVLGRKEKAPAARKCNS